jgi:alkylation response protein AidB-like acyl-CoA dehydrogenase
LGAIKTKAVRDGDDYRIVGQKVFITYGEHDFTANIVHLVLARVRGAPPGSKGISLFIVPKFLVKNDGSLGERNDLRCVSLEHKLGIAASPTCVMAYGDGGGAVGYLVGEENRGLEYMFTMMNNARLAVGLEGVAIAERAYQQARAYARQRVQGRDVAGSGGPVPIVRHPDVRRMLLFMKAGTEAARALTLKTAAWLDLSRRSPDARFRREAQAAVDLLIPVVKGWCTDLGVEIASVGIQVHGGVGFVEETGAAQYYRDARILPIYEGTNGIQAHDLLSRKLIRDGGAALATLVERMETTAARLDRESGDDLAAMRRRLVDGIAALRSASRWLLDVSTRDIRLAASGASPFMRLLGIVAGGWLMVESALAAARMLAENRGDATFLRGKIVTARFFADQILSQAAAIGTQVASGASISAIADEQF